MSKPESWKSWEGRLVDGKFPLRQWLGGSDHSAVFLTEVPETPVQKGVIKLMQPESGSADRQVARLHATTKLAHPNLIRTLEAGPCEMDGESLVYVVMEGAEEDLSQILPQRALQPAEVADLLPPLLGALSYLHDRGLVHGRIKPSNVLAVGDQLKLSSDQVASVAEQDSERRRRDAYDAPETAAGIISAAGDVWSVGVTMIAALTRNVTFAEQESETDPGLPPNIPEPYRGIARECLHLDPKQRCKLKDIQQRLQPPTRPVASQREPSAPVRESSVRKRSPFAVTIGLAIVLAILFAVFYFRGSKPPVQSAESKQDPPTSTVPAPASEAPKPAPKAHSAGGEVTHQVLPEVPQSAKNTITGTIKVVVNAQVDPSGKVTSARLKSAGSSRYFAGLALKAAQKWEFSAPEINGQPAASAWQLQFRFRRTSTQASAQRVNS